ncbi:Cadmium-transporting ATPase [BD1-7 clade bacterium]|uniref:P-type Zn(2+) transporter n=1 Tax=BD1-7 clade bacterium TaxID=2029982 RepID=A0A5S9QFT2_9GAMM|nr:Cadmium-transporting ATPase [BD1-7 clade bacterium]
MEKTALSLELLTDIDQNDACIDHFLNRLKSTKGLDDAHLLHREGGVYVCLHFDPNLIPLSRIQRLATEIGIEFSSRFRHDQLPVNDLNSADAANTLAEQLGDLPGILHADVSYAAGFATFAYDSELISLEAIRQRIDKRLVGSHHRQSQAHQHTHPHSHTQHPSSHDHSHGHGHTPEFLPEWIKQRWSMVLVALAGVSLLFGAVGSFWGWYGPDIVWGFYLLAYVFGGYDVASHAIPGLFRGRFDTDILMLAAAAGAAVLEQWGEGAFLLFLFSIGHAGEHYALDKARHAVSALTQLMPEQATKVVGDDWVTVVLDQLAAGDTVRVLAGDRMPVDGTVVDGSSHLDQSAITGESKSVRKGVGDDVFAGTMNQDGVLIVTVTRLAGESTLGRVMKLVAEAQSQQSPTQQMTQKFTAWFVPAVLVAVVLLTAIPPLFGWMTLDQSFYRSMLLLVAASPCALAIGTPAAMLSGIAQAARNGVLIKGGVHLENLGRLRAVAFDKTGTLTQGQFQLIRVQCVDGLTEDDVLKTAAALEAQSTHPLAKALIQAAELRQLQWPAAEDVQNHAGSGLSGKVDGIHVRLGKPSNFALTVKQQTQVSTLEKQGYTLVMVERDQTLIGWLAFGDQVREEASSALAKLADCGIRHRLMLTGDNADVAARVGESLGLTDVRANLLPADKLQAINDLNSQYQRVAMVGDGVNDAPALAQANVGIAMGGAGSDVALETADVVLMADDLSKIPFAVKLGQLTRKIVKQNLAIALSVIGLLIATSVLGIVDLSVTVILHEGSTLVVVMNALRLLAFRD